ncbi:MAG: response regulator transcription factor [Chitinophagaceae bacterium]|nr:response regulator transcription factor [Chitinophagaceae bacterium]
MEKITIMIADDHKLIRETWTYILNRDDRFEVIAECANSEEAVEKAKSLEPQIILMDINMLPYTGLEATQKIRQSSPASRIIGISMHSQPAYAKKMLQSGARGYVTKNSSKDEMITAIIEVMKGNRYLCDEIKNIISDQMINPSEEGPNINMLTDRELQIINCVKEGLSSKEIGEKLSISLKTVEVHRHNVLKKLKLKNVASLVNFINSSGSYI